MAVEEKIKNSTGSSGGGDLENTKTSVARDFNEALMNSTVDLITADMTIWGDPYFIADSGMGNYNAGETDLINLTADGTMDQEQKEDGTPRALHYTEGGPWFDGYRDCEYADDWKKEVINLFSA